MLRIFDRYLLKEVIYGWLAVTVVLWLVLVSNRLVQYLAEAAEGNIPGSLIFNLLALKMVWYLVLVVPFALALGVVLGLSRLYRDNEMVVMSACGVGPARIYRPLLGLSMIVAVLIAWLSLYVSPDGAGHERPPQGQCATAGRPHRAGCRPFQRLAGWPRHLLC